MTLRTGTETLVGTGIVLLAAALLAFVGHRIRQGDLHLIAGYDSDAVGDEAALADLVGTTTLALGFVTVLFGVGMLFVEPGFNYWGSYVLVLLAGIVVVQVRGRSFTHE